MSTPSEISGERPQLIAGMATPVTRSVADDLAEIFPHQPPPRPETALQLVTSRGDLTATKRPAGGRIGTLGAIAAAALLGVAAGVLIGHGPGPAQRSSQPAGQMSAAISTARPARAPVAQPPAEAAKAEAPPRARLHKVVVRRSEAARHRFAKAHPAFACRETCRAPSVDAANERLRRAYDGAVDAGVSQNVLVDYHAQWEQLRHQAPSDPGAVAVRYGQLAGELDSMAAGRLRQDQAPPGRPRAWLRRRTQLAELGR